MEPYTRSDHGKKRAYIRTLSGIVPYGRFVWEQANGPIPMGNIIRHLDGDATNCELSNLACLTRSEHARTMPPVNRVAAGLKAWNTRNRKMRERLGLPITN